MGPMPLFLAGGYVDYSRMTFYHPAVPNKGETTSMTIPTPRYAYVNGLRIAANETVPAEAWSARDRALHMGHRLYTLDQAKDIRDAIDGVINYVEGNKPKEPTFLEKLDAAPVGSKIRNLSLYSGDTFIKLGTGKWIGLKYGDTYRSSNFNGGYTLTEA